MFHCLSYHFSVLTTPEEQAQRFIRYLQSNGRAIIET